MKNILKSVGILTIISVIPGAFAATSRVGVYGPNLRGSGLRLASYVAARTSSTPENPDKIFSKIECVDNYTACIKGNDACGADMEECTTNVLFHAQMPKCVSTLMQCNSDGVKELFGNGDISVVGTEAGATKNSYDEITRYAYPTNESILGQMISAAKIENMLPSEQCSKKYTKCLQKDSVCGEDFELCTDYKEFKKQALSCASTLERCDGKGKEMLFGQVANADTLRPGAKSVLYEMIQTGADLAARNAVATCYRVTDQCILNACALNPNKCIEGIDETLIRIGDAFNGGRAVSGQDVLAMGSYMNGNTKRNVNKFIEDSCKDTVASNKYCYMVATGKAAKKDTVNLSDDEKDEIFSDIYSGTDEMQGRYAKLQDQIVQLWDEFNADAQEKCVNTIASCAMRSCGSGLGSVCFSRASAGNGVVHINSNATYTPIENACTAIVGNEASCQYSARFAQTESCGLGSGKVSQSYGTMNLLRSPAMAVSTGGRTSLIRCTPSAGMSNKNQNTVFSLLFPKYTETPDGDPIGVVGVLNSTLATSYNAAAIAELKQRCRTTALSCVKAMCGKDYTNCYRNRTDIVSGSYDTGRSSLDRSMNKMGGILDYNIVMGLCMNTITTADACDEHLKIAANAMLDEAAQDKTSWGYSVDTTLRGPNGERATVAYNKQYDSVRDGWLGANTTKVNASLSSTEYVIACAIDKTNAVNATNDACEEGATMLPVDGKCGSIMDEDGCMYTKEVRQDQATYVLENAGKSLFQELLRDVEMEAQAKYNAKLTKEQNICIHNEDNKGIMGATDNGSTFMWVKLKSSKIPKDYTTKGLQPKQFQSTGDLYGAFCRARVTIQSDDKDIQEELAKANETTAYFAVGDTFTCGSWISQSTLSKIANRVGERAVCKEGYGTWDATKGTCDVKGLSTKEKTAYAWSTIAGFLGGGALGTGLTESGTLTKALKKANKNNSVADEDTKDRCIDYADRAIRELNNVSDGDDYSKVSRAENYASSAYRACKNLDVKGCKDASFGRENKPGTANVTSGNATIDEQAFISAIGRSARSGRYSFTRSSDNAWYLNGSTSQPASGYGITANRNASGNIVVSYVAEEKDGKLASGSVAQFKKDLEDLKDACETYDEDDDGVTAGAIKAMRITVPIVTSLAGGGLGAGIAASVIQNKKENIQNTEMFKFMDEIGQHIVCYVGGAEMGEYGTSAHLEVEQ